MFKTLSNISIVLILMIYSPAWAQTSIGKIALSIADTSQSELEQAKAIYNWISSNINYDVKSFVNHSPKYSSPEQTLKSKKGLCDDYAELMTELCKSLNIEAYTVHGYSKGFEYYSGKVFTRSNHSWNVIRADSNWIIADPTWGSGFLEYKPKPISGNISKILNNHFSENKISFQKQLNNNYFNIPSDKFIKTHYPLSPEWLIETNPPSYTSFEKGLTDSSIIVIEFQNEIENRRSKTPDFILIHEGESGLEQNSNNHFDIAHAVLVSTRNFDPNKEISNDNIHSFKTINERCQKIISDLDKQQIITDSLYKLRIQYLNQFNSNHAKANKRIENSAISAQKNFAESKNNYSKKEESLYKKISSIENRIELLKESGVKNTITKKTYSSDPDQERTIRLKLADFELQQPHFEFLMDSLQNALNICITIDAKLNDSISVINRMLINRFEILKNTISENREQEINIQSDTLWNLGTQINFLFDRKKINHSLIDSLVKVFTYNKNQWEYLLKEKLTFLNNAYKTYNYPEVITDVYNNSLAENISLYRHQISFNEKLITHNGLQQGFIKENLRFSKKMKKNATMEYRYFTIWYNTILDREKGNYQYDKKLIGSMKKEASKKLNLTTKGINQYQLNRNSY